MMENSNGFVIQDLSDGINRFWFKSYSIKSRICQPKFVDNANSKIQFSSQFLGPFHEG